jgi:hypothetical protein
MRPLSLIAFLILISLAACARVPVVQMSDWAHMDYLSIDCKGREHLSACKPDPDDHINDTSRGRGGKGK